jgi:hypothetical protein
VLLLVLGMTAAISGPAMAAPGARAGRAHAAGVAGPAAATHRAELGAPAMPDGFSSEATLCAQLGHGYCLNRNACDYTHGSPVIVWNNDADQCEIIRLDYLSGMCGSGFVTADCPFPVGSGLNGRYEGKAIVAINFNSGGCLANGGPGGGSYGVIGTCPDINGNNGSNGSIFVLNDTESYFINRYWSDYYYNTDGLVNFPIALCSPGTAGQQVIMNDTPQAGICQWGLNVQ